MLPLNIIYIYLEKVQVLSYGGVAPLGRWKHVACPYSLPTSKPAVLYSLAVDLYVLVNKVVIGHTIPMSHEFTLLQGVDNNHIQHHTPNKQPLIFLTCSHLKELSCTRWLIADEASSVGNNSKEVQVLTVDMYCRIWAMSAPATVSPGPRPNQAWICVNRPI